MLHRQRLASVRRSVALRLPELATAPLPQPAVGSCCRGVGFPHGCRMRPVGAGLFTPHQAEHPAVIPDRGACILHPGRMGAEHPRYPLPRHLPQIPQMLWPQPVSPG